jgi:hypothetical protein
MTKQVKLTESFMKYSTALGRCVNGKCWLWHAQVPTLAGESFVTKDIVDDNTKVPIYDLSTAPNPRNVAKEDLSNYIVRYEGSNATPATNDITYYECCEGETVDLPTELADTLIANGTMKLV